MGNLQEKLRLLTSILGEYDTKQDEYLFYCPYTQCKIQHSKKKFSVNIKQNVYKCWYCNKRSKNIKHIVEVFGTAEQLIEWDKLSDVIDLSEYLDSQPGANQQIEEISLPKEFISLVGKNKAGIFIKPLNYLEHRSLSRQDINQWKIGFCCRGEHKDRIIIPSFDREGKCNYFISRSYTKYNRYKNPEVSKDIIFNELNVDWSKDIVLVEGVFDAIRTRNDSNSLPLLGSTLSTDSKLFNELLRHESTVYIALDKDARIKEKEIIKQLLQHGITVYKIDTRGFKDIGEMPHEEFSRRKQTAMLVTGENYILYNLTYADI